MLGVQEADDSAQSTFIEAVLALPRFRGRASARTWLLAIARHVCLDQLRGSERRRRRDQLLQARAEPAAPDPSREIEVADLLGRLDADRRTAFVLTRIIGLSYEEAASVCDCPIGTIRSRVARARSDLVDLFDELGQRRQGLEPGRSSSA